MPPRRALAAGGLALLLLGGLAWQLRRPPAPPPVASTTPSLELGCEPGQIDRYELRFSSQGFVDAVPDRALLPQGESQSDSGIVRLSTEVEAQLLWACVEREPSGARRYRVEVPVLDGAMFLGEQAFPIDDDVREVLSKGYEVLVEPDGRVRALRMDELADPQARMMARQIAGLFQLARPPEAARSWQLEEEDAVSRYLARYELLDESGDAPGSVLVRKRSEGRTPGGLARNPFERLRRTAMRSRTEERVYEIEPSIGRLREAAGGFGAELALGSRKVTSDETVFYLRWLDRRAIEVARLAKLDAVESAFGLEALQKESREFENRRMLEAASVVALLDEVKRAPPGAITEERATFERFLDAFVESDPGALAHCEKLLSAPDATEMQFGLVAAALSRRGGREAQAVLARVLAQQPKDHPGRHVLLVALGRSSEVSDDTLALLRKLADHPEAPDDRATALYMLGAAAGEIEERSPERAAAVIDRLLGELAAAKSGSGAEALRERVDLLRALGNSGSSRPVDAVLPEADAADPDLRAAAIDALRFVTDARAVPRIHLAAKADESPSVRLVAIATAALRPTSAELVAVFVDRVEHDSEDVVRRAAFLRLDELCPFDAGACTELDRIEKSGPDHARKLAAELRSKASREHGSRTGAP